MRLFGLAPETQYGVAEPELTIHQRFEKASFGVNSEPVSLRLGSKDIQAARLGYMEPSGSTETTMDSKTFQYILFGLLGNYWHGTNQAGKHVHQFYGGENTRLPSFTADFVYDFARKQLVGVQVDEVKIDIKDDLITVATEWIYKTEKGDLLKDKSGNLIYELEDQGLVSTANYTAHTVNGIPYIGYDSTILIDNVTPSAPIKDCSISIKVNHNREGARGITYRTPVKKPSTQDREIEITLTTSLDINTYKMMVAAEYGVEPTELGSQWQPHACRFTTKSFAIGFQTCEDNTEKVKFVFPKCLIQADVIEVNGTDEVELSFTLIPMGGDTVTLYNGNTTVTTAIYAQVINDQPDILNPNGESSQSGGS